MTWLSFCSSVEQAGEVVELAGRFCRFSGAEINMAKSEGAWLGEWACKPRRLFGIDWKDSLGSYLGVNLNLTGGCVLRWRGKLAAAERKLQPWRTRHITMFSRAHVCNALVYPPMLYSARITTIDASTTHKLHRLWAAFIWRSTYEPMRRSNLFWSLEKEGVGLVNVHLKLIVQRFLYFRNQPDSFLRAALQHLGSAHLARWVATSEGLNHGLSHTGFYKEVAAALAGLEEQFSWKYLLAASPRRLYWDLLAKVLPPPLYRQPSGSAPSTNVLRRVRALPVPTGSKDFFFRFHVGVLPVMARQESRGFFLPYGSGCILCGQKETSEHVFLACNIAHYFWDEIQSFFGTRWEITWSSLRFLNAEAECPDLRDCVFVLGLHSLWRARTDTVGCSVSPKPAWRHFIQKVNWTTSALEGPESDETLREALEKGGQVASSFKTKEAIRRDKRVSVSPTYPV